MTIQRFERRRFLFAAAAGLARAQTPRTVVFATRGIERLASVGTLFRRAYTACPQAGMSGLLTGMFPHAGSGPPSLNALLSKAGHTFQFIDGPLPDAALLPGSIAVCASAAGNGDFRESEVRMPLAILAPGLDPGESGRLVSAVDIVPTVLALCAVEPPEGLHGHNLLRERPEWVCMEGRLGQPGEWRAIVRGYEKLVVNRNGDVTHLFNLSEDPEEMDNLATHYEKSQQIRRTADALKALLLVWRKQTNDGRSGSGLKTRGRK